MAEREREREREGDEGSCTGLSIEIRSSTVAHFHQFGSHVVTALEYILVCLHFQILLFVFVDV
jgi:hypothetical protein